MLQSIRSICRAAATLHPRHSSSSSSSSNTSIDTSIRTEWRRRRDALFTQELERQRGAVGRVEKIKVTFQPRDKEAPEVGLMMNKDISTPHDCARHSTETVLKTAALALVDGEPYDMHRPLTQDCSLKLLTMKMPEESASLNTAFWRTCSFVLGAMIDGSFKDEVQVYLHSFPRPNVLSGSFIYDTVLDLPNWKPTDAEMRAMSARFVKIINSSLPLERLQVSESLALDMFQENPYKTKQIPEIAKWNDSQVVLYRVGDHVDISKGPMVGNTSILGRATVTAVHKVEAEETDRMYRFQGIAVPRGAMINHVAYGVLEKRARKLNETSWVPQIAQVDDAKEMKVAAAAQN